MATVQVKLTFPEELVREPLLAQVTSRFGVTPNIRRADVEEHRGWLVCEVAGPASSLEEALEWLRGLGVEVDLLGDVLEG